MSNNADTSEVILSGDVDKPEKKLFKYGEESLSDVIFLVDGNEFHCHKMLLAAKSSFFAAMFTSGFKEKNEERIEIKETDAVAFKRLMQILYDSRIEDEFLPICEDVELVEDSLALWTDTCALFKLADRFLVLDVVRNLVELHFFLHDRRCTVPDCYHCPMKLLLALRFKMDEYRKMTVSKKPNLCDVVKRVTSIEDEFVCSMEAIQYLLTID